LELLFLEELDENLIIQPPTFGVESSRPNNQIFLLHLLWSSKTKSSGTPLETNQKCFKLNLQLLMSKVGGQARTSYDWELLWSPQARSSRIP